MYFIINCILSNTTSWGNSTFSRVDTLTFLSKLRSFRNKRVINDRYRFFYMPGRLILKLRNSFLIVFAYKCLWGTHSQITVSSHGSSTSFVFRRATTEITSMRGYLDHYFIRRYWVSCWWNWWYLSYFRTFCGLLPAFISFSSCWLSNNTIPSKFTTTQSAPSRILFRFNFTVSSHSMFC